MTATDLKTLADALRLAVTLGATTIPPTHFAGVVHALHWAERELKRVTDSES